MTSITDMRQARRPDQPAPRTDGGTNLADRSCLLPAGHPSSPWAENGSARAPAPKLRDLEATARTLSDGDWSAHVRVVRTGLEWGLKEGWSTHERHAVSPQHGIWSPERAARQDAIVAGLYAAAAGVPCDWQAVIAGGLGGAGKTTALDQHAGIDATKYLTIDPDAFKAELARRGMVPEVPGLSPMEATALAHRESSYLARRLALRAMADGKNLIWDITMSCAQSAAGRVSELRGAGYQAIDAIFVDIPIETSVSRAESRHRRGHDSFVAGHGLGGRFLPAEVIRFQADPDYGSVNRRAFEVVKHQADRWSRYDNSVDGAGPALVDHGRGDHAVLPAATYLREPYR
jgi:Zeta toxin